MEVDVFKDDQHQLKPVVFTVTDQPMVFIAPGSVWPTKKWTLNGFTELASELKRKHFLVILIGSPQESELCQKIADNVSGTVNLAGKTSLFESAWLLQRGQLLIANDSGASHLAAVVGLPTIAIFGPTTSQFGYRPWQNKAMVVEADLACRPCGVHGGEFCPIGTHDCMQIITAQDVLLAVKELIEGV